MFKLNYIFINPFYQKSNALCKEGDSLYKIKINSIDYKEIRTKVECCYLSYQNVQMKN